MKNTENKYYFESVYEHVSAGLLEVACYDINTDIELALIELKYTYDDESENWEVLRAEFYTNPTINKAEDLISELKFRASDEFHEFCYECSMYEEFNEDKWFI